MMVQSHASLLTWLGPVLLSTLLSSSSLLAATPEEETLRISEMLRPIPDSEWNQIAGEITNEKYEVIEGDNLYDISQRLFGNGLYWPKIWALNNESITNPHLIYPGQMVVFTTGSGTTLPTLGSEEPNLEGEALVETEEKKAPEPTYGVQVAENDPSLKEAVEETGIIDGAKIPAIDGRSQEWKFLTQQRWDNQIMVPPDLIDELGFDRRSVIRLNVTPGADLDYIVQSDDLPILGEIKASWNAPTRLIIGDTLYIKPNGELQLDEDYSITAEPKSITGGALAYPNIGRVRITGVRSDLFVAEITQVSSPVKRGMYIVPQFDRVRFGTPKPGPNGVEARIRLTPRFDARMATQNTLVFIDRGSDDGVEPNMIFRAYQYIDPATSDDITSEDFIRLADVQVMQVSRNYSTGWIIYSRLPITEGTTARLLTNVSEFLPANLQNTLEEEPRVLGDEDELDLLDSGGEMTEEEANELKQLEDWESNPKEGFEFEDDDAGAEAAPSTEPSAPLENEEAENTEVENTPTTSQQQADELESIDEDETQEQSSEDSESDPDFESLEAEEEL